jgi:hypothetical protein
MAVNFADCEKKYYYMSDNIKETDIQKHVSDNTTEQNSN